MKKIVSLLFVLVLALGLAACGNSNTKSDESGKDSTATEEKKDLKIGATSGPYADMVNKAIKPLLEKKGIYSRSC